MGIQGKSRKLILTNGALFLGYSFNFTKIRKLCCFNFLFFIKLKSSIVIIQKINCKRGNSDEKDISAKQVKKKPETWI